jgi:outer membrane biosynthesis protein TonB
VKHLAESFALSAFIHAVLIAGFVFGSIWFRQPKSEFLTIELSALLLEKPAAPMAAVEEEPSPEPPRPQPPKPQPPKPQPPKPKPVPPKPIPEAVKPKIEETPVTDRITNRWRGFCN